jgi:hypothetical protein
VKEDIYEGGEEEDVGAERRLQNMERELEEEGKTDESTDEELDPEDETNEERRQRRKVKTIPDWRDTHNWFQAFWLGKLRHNDYQIIFSLILAHIALGLCALGICLDT